MSYLIGQFTSNDELSRGYDSSFPDSNFQVSVNTVSFGQLSAFDLSDYFQLNLDGSGHYTVFVSTDAINNYSANHQWLANSSGVAIEIVDRYGYPLQNLNFAVAHPEVDGSINFDYNGGASYGDFFVKISNLSYGVNDYVVSLSHGSLAGMQIDGTIGHDYLVGSNGDDDIFANAGPDTIIASPGDDIISGGSGLDTLILSGKINDYFMQGRLDHFELSDEIGNQGKDTVSQVERLIFSDGAIALDIDGNAGQAYRLYDAAFGRQPDLQGLGFWIDKMDAGMSISSVAQYFVQSAEFQSIYGRNVSSGVLVEALYQNTLNRASDADGFRFWTYQLDHGKMNAAQVVASFSESAEHQAMIIGQIQNGIDYLAWMN
ncbi:MAG: DUF4214 domain-containing protein [Undibacterium sp.]|nr:DUF4214 domain-containing protein [Undibacterium sp.]